ncbi:MAG: PDZ domain-containing protein [Pirellulales bacterium]
MNKTWLCVVLVCWGGLSSSAVAQPALERLEAQVRGLVNQDDGGAANPAGAQAEPGYLGGFFDDRNENGAGVRVTQVLPGGPAERAGLRAGDLITVIDGRRVTTIDEFAAVLGEMAPGDKPRFELDRAGRTHRLEVTLGRRPPRDQRPIGQPLSEPIGQPGLEQPPGQPQMNLLGVRLLAIDARMAADLQLPVARGALVTEILEGSPAQAAGLPREAIIVALDGKRVDTPADLARLASQAGAGSEVELAYYSQGRLFERKLRLAALDPALAGADEPPPLPEGTEGELPPPDVTDEDASGRIARLERRVRELEARLAQLERLLAERPGEEDEP